MADDRQRLAESWERAHSQKRHKDGPCAYEPLRASDKHPNPFDKEADRG